MEDKNNEVDKLDDVMLPGFRFHPTDEELVDFYLRRKIQQRALPIELIKQVNIYKYDPWDLPKLASTGEKEWYFYCPRDRKYRNSARPNRVTGAGFWKATGTDRPIYSSDGTKCIGLKKSLVFYRGRAAKGIKTDWMMHEFRLPSLTDSAPPKKPLDKNLSQNDSWAICRIFKKTNSMAQRALSHSWVSSFPEHTADTLSQSSHCTRFSSENMSCTTECASAIQYNTGFPPASTATFSILDISSYKPINSTAYKPSLFPVSNGDLPAGFMFSSLESSAPTKSTTVDVASLLLNLSPALVGEGINTSDTIDFGGSQQQFNGFSISSEDMQENIGTGEDDAGLRKNMTTMTQANSNQWGTMRSIGFPLSLPPSLPWDSPPCPNEISTSFPVTKCYT